MPSSFSEAALLAAFSRQEDDFFEFTHVCVVVAHPDDETLGASSCLRALRNADFVYVTDGAPMDGRDARAAGFATRSDYARARSDELHTALSLARISPMHVHLLGITDREASFRLADITRALAQRFHSSGTEVVLTQAYEGGHPDHDATAFAVHAACHLLRKRGEPVPVVIEMTSYNGEQGDFTYNEFLPGGDREIMTVFLSAEQQAFKRRLLRCYASQHLALRELPLTHEKFRLAPDYVFSEPPHPGKLLYERFSWGVTGDEWRTLAHLALEELGFSQFFATSPRANTASSRSPR